MSQYKLAPLKEEPLKEPEMPDLKVKVPKDFLQKIAGNRADILSFEKRAKALEEKI